MTCLKSHSKDTACLAVGWPGSAVGVSDHKGPHGGRAGSFLAQGTPGSSSVSPQPVEKASSQVEWRPRCTGGPGGVGGLQQWLRGRRGAGLGQNSQHHMPSHPALGLEPFAGWRLSPVLSEC